MMVGERRNEFDEFQHKKLDAKKKDLQRIAQTMQSRVNFINFDDDAFAERVDKTILRPTFKGDEKWIKKLTKFDQDTVYLTPFVNQYKLDEQLGLQREINLRKRAFDEQQTK